MAVDGVAEGYYTFSATATDKAGNETASGSRVALHDPVDPDARKVICRTRGGRLYL